jgi:WD40 repeat protein
MSRRKRRILPVTGLLAVSLAAVLISCLQLRWKPPSGGGFPSLTLQGHSFPVQALAFGPDGITLTSVECDLGVTHAGVEVAVWDVRTGSLVTKHLEYPGPLRCRPALALDGRRLAATVGEDATAGDREVVLWDVAPWRERRRLAVPELCGNMIDLSDDLAQLATTDYRNGITIWDTDQGRARSACNVKWAVALAFAPGGTLLACGATDFNVWLCNPATGEAIGALRGHERCVYGLSFSPDGRTLASRDSCGAIKLWDVAAKTLRATLLEAEDNCFRDEASAIVFFPDGKMLAVAVDRVVQLWDVAAGKLVARLEGHEGKVKCLAFSPDGTRLASGSYDLTVRLWGVPGR